MAGKVLVITGGSRGIGAATARKAGAEGFAVAVNYHSNAEAAQQVVADIEKAGGTAIAVQADVSTEDGAKHLFAETDAKLGRVTALFNNAGILQTYTKMGDFRAADLDEMWRQNITGQFLCGGEAVNRMSTAKGGPGGTIVNMSSAAARIGGANGMLSYAAAKGAIDTLTIGMATELGPQGIRVNAVRPGLIETAIHDSTGDMQRLEKLVGGVPLGRTGLAEEVADTVLYLLSERASYVSGALVDVGGGR
jgi:NAD(P)-dependent dehydrogenase (short-subunit alcohol dehydrogenase family)